MSDAGFHSAMVAALRTRGSHRLDAYGPAGLTEALGVYRNTVIRGAIDVLGGNYPAVRFLSGEGNFAALATTYWQARPPQDGPMLLYGSGFADHLEAESAPGMPDILPAIARLDRAWGEAHHSADAAALASSDMRGLTPEAMAGLRPGLHPSVRLPSSDRPVFATWKAARFSARIERAGTGPAETVLIWRPALEVTYRVLTTPEAVFVGAVAAGATLAEAGERSGAAADTFIRLLKDGVFSKGQIT